MAHHAATMTPINPALRGRATESEVLECVAARLREHPLLNNATVVVEDQSIPEAMPAGGYCLVVAPGAGEFPHTLVSGGGHAQCTEDGSVTIGIYKQSFKDKLGSKEAAMLKSTPNNPSLLEWKRLVIRQLLVGDDETILGDPQMWEPSIDGRPLLRDLPLPVRATAIMDIPDHPGWKGLQVTFSMTWDWDLYRA